MRPSMTIVHHSLQAIALLSSLVLSFGCHPDPSSRPSDPIDQEPSCEAIPRPEGCETSEVVPSHSPQCIAVDGELCLFSVDISDGTPRPDALTPDEPFEMRSISIFNAGSAPIELTKLSSRVHTGGLRALEGELDVDQPAGRRAFLDEQANIENSAPPTEDACQRGVISRGKACTFELSFLMQVNEDAPTNAVQRLKLSTETYRGARYEWDVPLLIVDPIDGLSVSEVRIEESGEDGALHSGDRIRITEIELINSSLAPFKSLRGLLSFNRDQINVEGGGEFEVWSPESVSGLLSEFEVSCGAATSSQESGESADPRCLLRFAHHLKISPTAVLEEPIEFELHLRDQGESVSEVHTLTFELSPWAAELTPLPLDLASDEDRDRFAAPGERVAIRRLGVENISDSALSLRGRVMIDSELVRLSGASDISINESAPRDDFFESCPAQSTCPLDVNLILEISEEATVGDLIPLSIELVDHTSLSHNLEVNLEIIEPDIQLILAEFEVRQDTLDQELSAGERGVISYLKILNDGLADARGLEVEISTESPWVTFEDAASLRFSLNTDSDEFDMRSSACPSLSHEPEGYCYRRPEVFFRVAEEAPFGELIQLKIELTDTLGTTHELSYSLTLF